ncbi:enoyl-CoA hydratase/isomerase family protein [Salipaludibacillus sp. CUR1]|uniref:enoyl-CoA hydratase/isomerase family protein n=1 Tax=Salipaludibacillus sp. CUR1 TaxID=2820003 RepID=UPI001E3D511A|nr:enoyl-CoA hydratase/isomerase family protein [Salipaludibacillus sp. CUR1]MCE7794716.1 enoyl-CoA hydratase/isomerase family protein [Salipaludibacillus sp. CUR1]
MAVMMEYLDKNTARIILNRPARKNAVNFEMIHKLNGFLEEIDKDKDLTVLWIQGEGKAFCSGGDLEEFHSLRTSEEAKKMLIPMSGVLKKIVSLDAVTVSYLNGPAVGGGAELASSTDFTLGNASAKAGFIQGNLAITTGWGGASLLKRRIGYHAALKMLATAKVYSVQELNDLGFVHQIVNDEKDVRQWCMEWVKSPDVVRAYKKNLLPEEEQKKLFELINQEIERCAGLWEGEAHHKAVEQFNNKHR